MVINEVIKGTDGEIEFKGFKGRYFTRLVVFVVGLLAFTFLSYGMGFNNLPFFFLVMLTGIGGFFYLRYEMENNRKFGHIHKKHHPPQAIVQNRQFFKFINR